MSLTPGARVGIYEVVSLIGRGGMGEVYRARDTNLGREVALKILPEAFAADADRVARFRREAQVLASLNHPNIAQIFGIEGHALAMELVDGRDLASIIEAGPVPARDIESIARQISDAIGAAHDAGIVHRDLKPANIVIRADGTVKVLDFGLAKAADGAGGSETATMTSPAMTAMGMILGTAAYMSPEQARGRSVDRRADIWAFGVIVYEMLTGRRLFPGETVSDTIAAVLTRDPDLSTVPAAWRPLLSKCLEREPRARLRDIGDAWLLFGARESSPAASSSARFGAAFWGTALLALAAGAVAMWLLRPVPVAVVPVVALTELPPAGMQFVTAPRVSPDGSALASIVRDAAGVTRIAVRDLAASSARMLEGTEGAELLFWSPDAKEIGFATSRRVQRVPAGGGAATPVVEAATASAVWLPNGDIVMAIAGRGLVRVSATGSALTPVAGHDSAMFAGVQITDLNASPDGQLLVYSQFGGETGIYLTRVGATERKNLFPGEQGAAAFVGPDLILRERSRTLLAQRIDPKALARVGDAVPVRQGVGDAEWEGSVSGGVSYLAAEVASMRLAWFGRDGKPFGTFGQDGFFREVHISHAGGSLAYVQRDLADGNDDIWVARLPDGAPSRFTSDPDIDHLAVFSPDDRSIAWEAHANGVLNVMRRAADGGSVASVIRPWGHAGGPTDWAGDGRTLIYRSADESGSNLWAVPIDQGATPSRIPISATGIDQGRFSPDGRALTFSASTTGTTEVYLQRMNGLTPTGGAIRVSANGGEHPLWRADGKELFFLEGNRIMAVGVSAADAQPTGTPKPLFQVNGPVTRYQTFAVTPDGQRFLVIVSTENKVQRTANVILNWTPASTTGRTKQPTP